MCRTTLLPDWNLLEKQKQIRKNWDYVTERWRKAKYQYVLTLWEKLELSFLSVYFHPAPLSFQRPSKYSTWPTFPSNHPTHQGSFWTCSLLTQCKWLLLCLPASWCDLSLVEVIKYFVVWSTTQISYIWCLADLPHNSPTSLKSFECILSIVVSFHIIYHHIRSTQIL